MTDVPATIYIEELPDDAPPGSIVILDGPMSTQTAGFEFICPCGCGTQGYLPIRMTGHERTARAQWEWDGNRQHPTLTPSVFNTGMPCRWHGWLRGGKWVDN